MGGWSSWGGSPAWCRDACGPTGRESVNDNKPTVAGDDELAEDVVKDDAESNEEAA